MTMTNPAVSQATSSEVAVNQLVPFKKTRFEQSSFQSSMMIQMAERIQPSVLETTFHFRAMRFRHA